LPSGVDDAEKGLMVFSVASIEEAMRVEGYLDAIGVVPDYRNNRKLLVLDLVRLVTSLAVTSNYSPSELLLGFEKDEKKRKEKMAAAKGSDRLLMKQAIAAFKEQAENQIGEKTVTFALSMIDTAKKALLKKTTDPQ
jgi:hypothetical protein